MCCSDIYFLSKKTSLSIWRKMELFPADFRYTITHGLVSVTSPLNFSTALLIDILDFLSNRETALDEDA